jgi:predicted Rossmann fold nucleotide-binding protein DprA/Smf involved in DNA uptake
MRRRFDGQSQQIQVSARPSTIAASVSTGCHRRHRATAVDVHDAVDDLVVDAIAADRNDQRSPGACRSMSQLACVTWVASRLEGDGYVRQLATKIISHAFRQR